MGARETSRPVRHRASAALAAAGVLGLGASACGEEDFPNEPRAPAPISVTAKVDSKKVIVSPDEFGAGQIEFTVSNQSEDPIRLTLVGPAPQDDQSSAEVPPGSVGSLKAALTEGDYEANAGERSDARPAQLTVGPERPSSQNELLLP